MEEWEGDMKHTDENTNPSDALVIGSAWLDAELFMRTGDTSCKHSTRLMGYRPRGAENATLVRGTDTPIIKPNGGSAKP